METYEVIFKDGQTTGVYGISLVDDPAIESMFIALKKETKIELSVLDEEKMLLLGAVLIPDKPIYRKTKDKEFNIVFPKETIALALTHFQKNGFQNSSTIEHDSENPLNDVTFVENWIKLDNEKDKSALYGRTEPIGSWFTVMKAHTREAYDKALEKKGFSIDGFFDLEKINLKSEYMELKSWTADVVNAIKEGFLSLTKPKEEVTEEVEVTLGMVKTADETITFTFEGDTVAKDLAIEMTAPDGTKLAVPDGEYTLEGDMKIEVLNSIVQSVAKAEVETPAEEAPKEQATMTNTNPQIKSEKTTNEVFYQLSKEDSNFLTEMSIDGNNSKDMARLATIVNALVEYNFGWQIREEERKKMQDDAIKAYGTGLAKQFAISFGQEIENTKLQLKSEFEQLFSEKETELLELAKNKPIVLANENLTPLQVWRNGKVN